MTVSSTSLMLVPSVVSAAIDAIETSERMSAYSTSPWPSSRRERRPDVRHHHFEHMFHLLKAPPRVKPLSLALPSTGRRRVDRVRFCRSGPSYVTASAPDTVLGIGLTYTCRQEPTRPLVNTDVGLRRSLRVTGKLRPERRHVYVGQLNLKGAGAEVVCQRCAVADRPFPRLRGLMGRRGLAPGEGLLLRPTPSIHTWFMRFPIDAVFLDADLRVLGHQAGAAALALCGPAPYSRGTGVGRRRGTAARVASRNGAGVRRTERTAAMDLTRSTSGASTWTTTSPSGSPRRSSAAERR